MPNDLSMNEDVQNLATEPAVRFAPGQLLSDRYRIIDQLGRGGMGLFDEDRHVAGQKGLDDLGVCRGRR